MERALTTRSSVYPSADPNWNHLDSLDDVAPHLLKEIGHFFTIYKELENKKTGIMGWSDKNEAVAAVNDSFLHFQKTAAQGLSQNGS
jgi:inorganic pyrophosphatase